MKLKKEINQLGQVSQHLIMGLEGITLSKLEINILNNYPVGGIIFFKHNYESYQQIKDFIISIKEICQKNDFQNPFFTVDQEGGRVIRFGSPFTKFPAQQEWEKHDSVSAVANKLAKELSEVGINMNFSPVVDIDQHDSFIVGDRAFCGEASEVCFKAKEVIDAYKAQKIISVIKHFPGHGAVEEDTHKKLPICNKSLADLMELDLIPFIECISHGVEAIMTAHILYPKIDKDNLATMSKVFLQDILRNKLKFEGLIISDDLEMAAVSNDYSIPLAVESSVSAGCDMVFVTHLIDQVEPSILALNKKYQDNEKFSQASNQSVARILALKTKFSV